ncbi:MAG: BatD family protein [Bacteriovoracaceae bacterium]|nr:BatD family protein [Bacteriovoracaceae bacterium]
MVFKKLSCILILFVSIVGFAADDVVVETNPRNPIIGETFQILFKCQTTGDSQPEISFKAEGFEVLGRQVQGLSTRTIYQNGKLSVSRELLISYDARADKAGVINLRDVKVNIDGRTITQSSIPIRVTSAPPEPRLVFLAADVPKKSVYVGEGVTVRYYLYKKTSLQAFDIKKYPKLDGFMKRYIQENENTQRVTVDGEIFGRSTIYSARLYPEKPGKLIVDPMDISATYAQDLFGNMGFGFGLGMRDLKTKVFSSEPVTIEVKALPLEGKPNSFTGLVGKHEFDLKINRNQILVNEPIDAKLTVSGPGNLENMETPVIWNVPQLEKFDSKADLALVGGESAIKTFDYTYLGKEGGEISAQKVEFSYFDPNSSRYETIIKELPELIVAGGAAKKSKSNETETPVKNVQEKEVIEKSNSAGFSNSNWLLDTKTWWLALLLLCLVIFSFKFKKIVSPLRRPTEFWGRDYQLLASGKGSSKELTRLLYELSPGSEQSVSKILEKSKLKTESKEYLLQLLSNLEQSEFKTGTSKELIDIDKRHLSALKNELRSKS